jgi:hypothetical protein
MYTDRGPIAFVELAAAVLRGLIWMRQPTAITLHTGSVIVYHTIVKGTGTGLTLWSSAILPNLFCIVYYLTNRAGHCLVTRWVPPQENLADRLSRGVLAS